MFATSLSLIALGGLLIFKKNVFIGVVPLKSSSKEEKGGTSIEDLLQKAGLGSAAIDQECTEEHILDIYQHLEKWELVSIHLGLKRADITAIKQDAAHDSELMRLYALQKWKSLSVVGGTDTFRVLLKALLKCGCTEYALEVCELLK